MRKIPYACAVALSGGGSSVRCRAAVRRVVSCVQDAAEERLLETVNAMLERRPSRTSGVLRVLFAP